MCVPSSLSIMVAPTMKSPSPRGTTYTGTRGCSTRTGRESAPYPQAAYLAETLAAAAGVTLSESERRGLEGAEIGAELRRRRLAALAAVKERATRTVAR